MTRTITSSAPPFWRITATFPRHCETGTWPPASSTSPAAAPKTTPWSSVSVRRFKPSMLPVVLHHGLFGLGNFQIGRWKVSYFNGGIERAIADRGHPLIIPRVHPTAGIVTRARQLKETILRQLEILNRPRDPIIIIAHSMGGLDARYMISCLGMADRVRALVTVSTPHRGSPYADWCLQHLGQRLGGLGLARFIGLDVQALADLTTESCEE